MMLIDKFLSSLSRIQLLKWCRVKRQHCRRILQSITGFNRNPLLQINLAKSVGCQCWLQICHETPCICLVLVDLANTSTSICWGLKAKFQPHWYNISLGEHCLLPAYAMCFLTYKVALAHAGGMQLHLQPRAYGTSWANSVSHSSTLATCQSIWATSTSKCWGMRTDLVCRKESRMPLLRVTLSFGKSLVFALCLQH